MKKILCVLLSFSMLISITTGVSFTVYANNYQGKCGDNVSFVLDSNSKTLTISGDGAMYDYYEYRQSEWGDESRYDTPPWRNANVVIEKVIINEGITYIGAGAFYEEDSITSITIPKSAKIIGAELLHLGYTSGIKLYYNGSIGDWCQIHFGTPLLQSNELYIDNQLVTDIVVGGITSISDSAFYRYDYLTSVTVQDGVEEIGVDAFGYCSNLSNIVLPNSINKIGKYAFSDTAYYNNRSNWENHTLYISNILIDNEYSSTPYDLTVKDGTYYIVGLEYCGCLSSIRLPNTIKYLTNVDCFYYGDFVEYEDDNYISVPIVYYDGTLSEWLEIKTPNFNSRKLYLKNQLLTTANITGVDIIPDEAFSGLDDLSSVSISDNVTSIGNRAFSGCESLKTINIGNNVESIGNFAFLSCNSITLLTIPNSVKTIGNGACQKQLYKNRNCCILQL